MGVPAVSTSEHSVTSPNVQAILVGCRDVWNLHSMVLREHKKEPYIGRPTLLGTWWAETNRVFALRMLLGAMKLFEVLFIFRTEGVATNDLKAEQCFLHSVLSDLGPFLVVEGVSREPRAQLASVLKDRGLNLCVCAHSEYFTTTGKWAVAKVPLFRTYGGVLTSSLAATVRITTKVYGGFGH